MKLLKITLFASILGSATFNHSLSAIANTRFETIDITTLTNQAARGDYHAQFFLAKRLQKGEGVAKDTSKKYCSSSAQSWHHVFAWRRC